MALTVGGAVVAFGANEHGQLGAGDRIDRWKPTRVHLAPSSAAAALAPCAAAEQRAQAAAALSAELQRAFAQQGQQQAQQQAQHPILQLQHHRYLLGHQAHEEHPMLLGQLDATARAREEQAPAGGASGGAAVAEAAAAVAGGDAGGVVRALQLACGASHTVALASARGRLQVLVVGGNAHGQLGLGDRTERLVFTRLPG